MTNGGRGERKARTNFIDVEVGARIRMRRMMLKMSQGKLATALGVTFQQVQKYERGTNRVGASRLQQISQTLQVPVSYFFEGLPSLASPEAGDGLSGSTPAYITQFLTSPDGLRLLNAYRKIGDSKLRRSVVRLVEATASIDPQNREANPNEGKADPPQPAPTARLHRAP